MRIPSGKTDQLVFFVALDSTDRVTRKTGLSAFTVYRSRNGGTATVYTTPTVTELSAANMPGVYALTVDEDTTIASGSDSEEYCVHITCATMAPVTRTVELYRRDVSSGKTLVVDAAGLADANMVKVGPTGSGTAQTARDIGASVIAASVTGLTASDVGAIKTKTDFLPSATAGAAGGVFIAGTNAATTVTTSFTTTFTGNLTGSVGSVSGNVGGSVASVTAGVTVSTNNDKTGYSLTQAFPSNFSALGISAGGHVSNVDTLTTYTGDTPQTGDAYARIGSAGAGLTALGDTRIAHLDADVSSRLASGSYTAPPSASTIAQAVWDVLTSALTTVGSIGKLLVTNIDAAISSRSTYAGADTSGTTTLLARPSPLDAAGTRTAVGLASANLDTQIGTLATSSALSTVNTTVNGINTKTTNLPSDPADASDIAGAFISLASHGDSAWATATGFSTLDATAVENAVWDATAASHATGGSFGGEVNDTASAAGTIEGRIGTPNFGDLASDIAHAQTGVDGIKSVTDSLVMTAGKLWVLDDAGNQLPHIGDIPAASDIAAAVMATTYEGSETVQDHFRLARAALYGKANGLAGTTVHYRDAADAKNRLTATVDGDGNRTAVTADAS